ncbi:aminotransferase class V-fold PLP-dependent enzyme [Thermostaphylospora chromogena]|uniref:Selenocysteine lyase/Cysteine desulfurase n=1 Tax=Thermostaphylospora chromogena TaxID=35622 RepID=A0A1H1H3C0_9ACTN|nr:aminotransferase class V-fold PLP-dependent enzyme [Thermostaphylospora chromogena]SDR20005.1 Selenocysteine lyase/Cysteine desulfurase [Thermostaphylospora chromogena]
MSGDVLERVRGLWEAEPGWLNTASYGVPPRTAVEAVTAAIGQWSHGSVDWSVWDMYTDRARAGFAELVGVPAEDVCVGATVSQLLSLVATALPEGARVVIPRMEFTSNVFPWAVAADVREVPLGRLAEAAGEADVVAFSLVQSASGEIAPVDEVVEAARRSGALVVVDATQACGWLPVRAERFDAVVCTAYKWLMAPRGAAYGYLSPRLRERMRPIAANWYAGADRAGSYYGMPLRLREDAGAFDLSPAWFSQVGAAVSLELLNEVGVERVRAHNVALADRFLAGLGLPPAGSAIVSVEVTREAWERLRRAGVRAAMRDGRLRASFHLYTSERDVDMAVEALTGRAG